MTDHETIQQVDPGKQLVDRNTRHQLGVDPEFVASIGADRALATHHRRPQATTGSGSATLSGNGPRTSNAPG